MKLYQRIAGLICARESCVKTGNHDWSDRHIEKVRELVKEHLPSGSGFDAGTTISIDESTSEKLVFITSFHHMDENGYYDGWTDHKVILRPSLVFDFDLRITGRDRKDIKSYICDVFHDVLRKEITAESEMASRLASKV